MLVQNVCKCLRDFQKMQRLCGVCMPLILLDGLRCCMTCIIISNCDHIRENICAMRGFFTIKKCTCQKIVQRCILFGMRSLRAFVKHLVCQC